MMKKLLDPEVSEETVALYKGLLKHGNAKKLISWFDNSKVVPAEFVE